MQRSASAVLHPAASQALTGIPVKHQEVMLQGIGHIVLVDKRAFGSSHSASTGSWYLGLLGAKEDSTAATS